MITFPNAGLACLDDPCQNGGTCNDNEATLTYTCTCLPQYVGGDCQYGKFTDQYAVKVRQHFRQGSSAFLIGVQSSHPNQINSWINTTKHCWYRLHVFNLHRHVVTWHDLRCINTTLHDVLIIWPLDLKRRTCHLFLCVELSYVILICSDIFHPSLIIFSSLITMGGILISLARTTFWLSWNVSPH